MSGRADPEPVPRVARRSQPRVATSTSTTTSGTTARAPAREPERRPGRRLDGDVPLRAPARAHPQRVCVRDLVGRRPARSSGRGRGRKRPRAEEPPRRAPEHLDPGRVHRAAGPVLEQDRPLVHRHRGVQEPVEPRKSSRARPADDERPLPSRAEHPRLREPRGIERLARPAAGRRAAVRRVGRASSESAPRWFQMPPGASRSEVDEVAAVRGRRSHRGSRSRSPTSGEMRPWGPRSARRTARSSRSRPRGRGGRWAPSPCSPPPARPQERRPPAPPSRSRAARPSPASALALRLHALRHVQDVAAPEPERTRRLPLHQLAERERHAIGLSAASGGATPPRPSRTPCARPRARWPASRSWGRAAGTRPASSPRRGRRPASPLISRTSTATLRVVDVRPSAFVRPAWSSSGVFPAASTSPARGSEIRPSGRTGTIARQLGLVPHDHLEHVLAPDAVLARVGPLRRPARSVEEAHAAARSRLRQRNPVRSTIGWPPGTHSSRESPTASSTRRATSPGERPPRTGAATPRTFRRAFPHAPRQASDRAGREVAAPRTGEAFPHARKRRARVAAAPRAHDVPSGRGRGGRSGRRGTAGGHRMLRATGWCVGPVRSGDGDLARLPRAVDRAGSCCSRSASRSCSFERATRARVPDQRASRAPGRRAPVGRARRRVAGARRQSA